MVETDVPNVTQGKRSRHRTVLQLLAVILHLILSKTVYEKCIRFGFENVALTFCVTSTFTKGNALLNTWFFCVALRLLTLP